MGGTLAKPRLSREQLLKSTANSREFINKLFQVMIAQITPEDFLKLGKSQTCNQFIFLMADNLKQIFSSLQIAPRRDKTSGVILFKKVDKLQAKSKETPQLCFYIAYFYIRILQIFGSLAISVLDDPGAGQVLGAVPFLQGPSVAAAAAAGKGAFLTGGAALSAFTSEKSRQFTQIRELLEDPVIETTSQGNPRKVFVFRDEPQLQIIPDRIEAGREQNMRITINDTMRLYGNMNIKTLLPVGGAKRLEIRLSYFRYVDSSMDPNILNFVNNELKRYNVAFWVASVDGGVSWLTQSISLPQKVMKEIQSLQKIIESLAANPGYRLEDLKVFEKAKEARKAQGLEAVEPQDKYFIDSGSKYPTAIKALQNEYIVQTLKGVTGHKSVSFCVARALQLLDINTLMQPKAQTGTTSVCMPTFKAMPGSVPQSGQTLDKVYGLHALDELYYTKIGFNEKNEPALEVADGGDYANFLQTLSGLFGKPIVAAPSGIDRIVAKDPACGEKAARHYLQIEDPKAIANVKSIIGGMFARQLRHTQAVVKFLREKLFVIRKVKNPSTGLLAEYIEIHPSLLKGDLNQLTKLSQEARVILLNYYKDCETAYQQGIGEILKARSRVL
jgi:hypothetical protein